MDDVQGLCERIIVVDHGRKAYDGTLDGLVARVGAARIMTLDLHEPSAPLDSIPGTTLIHVEPDGLRQRLALAPGEATAAAVLAQVSERVAVRDLTIDEPHIEDVVRRLYASGL